MKKITLLFLLFLSTLSFSQCLTALYGQYPAATFVPNGSSCDGLTSQTITTVGFASEYSLVTLVSGQTYTFVSSISSDVITISTDAGATAATFGTGSVTWVSTVSGDVRFYTHLTACGNSTISRTRSLKCGIPPCTPPTVTYAVVTNCPALTFNVMANISNLGSATSITVTDNQSSPSQQVTATGTVTFGPYTNGTSVILTATNDQFSVCNVVSNNLMQTQCPPANDNLANALAISCGSSYTGDTTYATLDEDNAPDGFGADMDAPNVWYSYTGSGTPQSVTLNLCGSSYDTSVLVYTGTSGSLTLVAGNDDDSSCTITTRSKVTFLSDGVTTYKIAIEGYNFTSVGAFTMDVSCAVVTPPAVANQSCDLALIVPVDGSVTTSDNSYGTTNPNQPSCDPFGSVQDVWFSFVAPSDAVDCLVSNTTMTSLNVNAYSGTCTTLTPLTGACSSNLIAPTTKNLTGLTPGAIYYIQVWSNASEQGTFTLKLTSVGLSNTSFNSDNFNLYPNPVKDILNLSSEKTINSVKVFNLLGQEVAVKNFDSNQVQIDLSSLSSGTYLLKIVSENQIKSLKIMKK
ncbi:MAG: T9SS type A sorting domain-containing protein [Flavobacterium sp.]|nr:T9SS type A sorting domain-containing protein [Flavobacterium sp.]